MTTLQDLRKGNYEVIEEHEWETYDPLAKNGNNWGVKTYPKKVISNGKVWISKLTKKYLNTGDHSYSWSQSPELETK